MKNEVYSTNGIECPYCGAMTPANESDGAIYDQDLDEWECSDCGKKFRVEAYYSWSWTSYPTEEL